MAIDVVVGHMAEQILNIIEVQTFIVIRSDSA